MDGCDKNQNSTMGQKLPRAVQRVFIPKPGTLYPKESYLYHGRDTLMTWKVWFSESLRLLDAAKW